MFDPINLTSLFVNQFFTWDELYRKFLPGSDDGFVRTRYMYQIMKFPRQNNGELDVSNKTYSREKVTLKNWRYTDEVRLCLGVSVMTPVIDCVEQPQEGRR